MAQAERCAQNFVIGHLNLVIHWSLVIGHWSFFAVLPPPSSTTPVPDPAPNPELLSSLGRLVRGLSALFWGLPIALVVCVQTAKGEWFEKFGIAPPVIATALL